MYYYLSCCQLLENEKSLSYPLSTNPTKWLNTRKQFVGIKLTNYLSVFNHFVGLALKGLTTNYLKGVPDLCCI